MIIGFGFGDPMTSLLMLLVTSFLSYTLFKKFRGTKESEGDEANKRERLRAYYHEQREIALSMKKEFDLSDEEIEQKIDEQLRK